MKTYAIFWVIQTYQQLLNVIAIYWRDTFAKYCHKTLSFLCKSFKNLNKCYLPFDCGLSHAKCLDKRQNSSVFLCYMNGITIHLVFSTLLKYMSKVVELLCNMCHNFTNFQPIFIIFSPNRSHRNEAYDDIKIYILNEKEKGEKEDQKFATSRNPIFGGGKKLLVESPI